MDCETIDDTYVVNAVAKYLSRQDGSTGYCEPWRFPLISSCAPASETADASAAKDLVTFVWRAASEADRRPVTVTGTFDRLCQATPLAPVHFDGQETAYRAVSVRVPVGEVHYYKFLIGGEPSLDPINPQRQPLDNGIEWSRFFTRYCNTPITLEAWEADLLMRLTNAILPFAEDAAAQFLDLYYFRADRAAQDNTYHQAYRISQPIGAVNFIDNLLSREESHRLIDYRLCLDQIDAVLRARFPGREPVDLSDTAFTDLYQQMAANNVDGWDTGKYHDPVFFLKLLRRHTYLGAFSHPAHGGNAAGAGWAFIEDRFRDAAGANCFDWRRAIEKPLGTSDAYLG
jgi:hypothetical protein